ncbi:hypothetical protein [Zymobacter sp. IVIA_12111.31 C1]|uniref:hypothetical protein n=1 Tax=Zymobacter sp. IVIA_12111.31 C1 TaxID=3394854 RepID=UPI0039C063B6
MKKQSLYVLFGAERLPFDVMKVRYRPENRGFAQEVGYQQRCAEKNDEVLIKIHGEARIASPVMTQFP